MPYPSQPIKLIALDLDGTLLQSDGTVSARTIQAVQAARARGVAVAIATGRMYATAAPYGKMLGLGDIPMLLYAGGLIQTAESKKILFEQAIDPSDAAALLALAKAQGWQMQTYIDDVLRVAVYERWIQDYEAITHCRAVVCGDAFYTPQGKPNKLLSRGEHDELVRRRQLIEEAMPGRFTILFSDPTFLEIMPLGVNKGTGLHRLGELFHVSAGEIMAVGDSPNDLDMLEAAGFSVAMGNAPAQIKAAADVVTAGNDEDGVAAAIETFVLSSVSR